MPEIKNTFTQGRMNKDLDERIIPNGEYRHAMNVRVTSSEDASVGVIQNLLGNIRADENIVPQNYMCIATIADDKNDNIYWFITIKDLSDPVDVILQHNVNSNITKLVLVDSNNDTLKFSNKIITGINVIDDFIFWTDNYSEPKKIHIPSCLQGTDQSLGLTQHTELFIENVSQGLITEDNITVIRKNPKTQPIIKITAPTSTNTAPLFEKVFPRFSFRYKYKDGEYSSFGPFTDVVFNPIYTEGFSKENAYSEKEVYNTAMVNSIDYIDVSGFKNSSLPNDVVQVEILYKEDGSSVVFSIKKINTDDEEWQTNSYTIKSESIFAAIPENQLLRSWDNVPKKALAQEVTGNRIVYGNYTQNYDLKDLAGNKVRTKLTAGYGLRQHNKNIDNTGIPSIKSQRKYQLGLVWGDKYGRETPVFTNDEGGVDVNWSNSSGDLNASVPSSLNLTIDSEYPSWADYYKVYVKETSGEYYNLLMTKAYGQKDLNVFDEEKDRVWLAFVSADRNKIETGDYLILKKKIDGIQNQISIQNKFKVLDVVNEAPDAIKFEYLNLGRASQIIDSSDTYLQNVLMTEQDNSIGNQTDMIHINRSEWVNAVGGGSLTQGGNNEEMYVENIYMSWSTPEQNSEKYRVVSIIFDNSNYMCRLDRPISEEDSLIAIGVETFPALAKTLIFKCERKEERLVEEFSGKFFAQIVSSEAITPEVQTANLVESFYISSSATINWFYDKQATNGNDGLNGVINRMVGNHFPAIDTGNASLSNPEDLTGYISTGGTKLQEDWDLLATQLHATEKKGWFIDSMYMAAGQIKPSNSLAKYAGETWQGLRWSRLSTSNIPQWIEFADNNGDPSGDYGWGVGILPLQAGYSPRAWGDNLSAYMQSFVTALATAQNLNVNGLEGFIETQDTHTGTPVNYNIGPNGTPPSSNAGSRRWISPSNTANKPFTGVPDNTYGDPNTTGKHYIHLSFLAPGVDLHDGFDSTNIGDKDSTTLFGKDSFGNYLQGIYGGGVFNDPVNLNTVEMEGNYNDANEAQATPPSRGVGQGYDNYYSDRHNNQWDPTYGGDSRGIGNFIQNLEVGYKFKFSSDADTIFEVMSTPIKKYIYNHTPWVARWEYDGVNMVYGNDSVDEAVLTWANDRTLVNFNKAKEKIVDFGRADNRRVCYIFEVDTTPINGSSIDTSVDTNLDVDSQLDIEFMTSDQNVLLSQITQTAAIWETEPKEKDNLDIYYEASQSYPTKLTEKSRELIAPVGCRVVILGTPINSNGDSVVIMDIENKLVEWQSANTFLLDVGFQGNDLQNVPENLNYDDVSIRFINENGSYFDTKIRDTGSDTVYGDDRKLFTIALNRGNTVGLSWFNCFSFGNGIESNRIKDDFNQPKIGNGVKASITLDQEYKEENRKNGLIFSGIYNSTSGVNNLNQFIMAENITKDLNPTYGSIQKLFQRRISLVTFCEDKVISITSNKDALFNADGNAQLVSTNAVLGDATPFAGDFGISKNPESFAKESYRAYFADKQRGAVLRLSMDGITPISDAGMDDYFRDNLKLGGEIVGGFDAHSKDYNLTIKSFKPTSNFIINSDLSSGAGTVDYTTLLGVPEVIVNGDLSSAVSFTPATDPTILGQLNLTNNRFLEFHTICQNYQGYLIGDIQGESQSTVSTQTSFTTFTLGSVSITQQLLYNAFGTNDNNPFSSTGIGIHSDNTYQVLRSYTSDFVTESIAEANTQADTNSIVWSYNSEIPYMKFPYDANFPLTGEWYTGAYLSFNNVGPSGEIFWNKDTDGYMNQVNGPFPGLAQVRFASGGGPAATHRDPWFNTTSTPNSGRGIVFDKTTSTQFLIFPGVKTNINDIVTPTPVLTEYPNTVPTTIFNGEEVRIQFVARGFTYVNTPGSPQAPPSTDHWRYVTIQLYDGATALGNSVIMDPTNLQGSITQGYADYNYIPVPQGAPSTTDECRIGFKNTSAVNFPVLEHNTARTHDVSFKFTNGSDETEAAIVQDLQVYIRFVDDDGNEIDELYGSIEYFEMTKEYQMTDVDGFTDSQVGNGDFVPPYDVTAFTRVQHVGFDDWSINLHSPTFSADPTGTLLSDADFNALADTTYGPDHDKSTITYTQVDGTTYSWDESESGPTFNGNGVSDPSNITNYNNYTNDEFVWDGSTMSGQGTLVQSFTPIDNNWYALYLDISSVSPTGDAPELLYYNVTFEQVTEFIGDYSTPVNYYRAIFQGDSSNANIKIKLYENSSITIRTINLIDISETYTGGTASNWNLLRDNSPENPNHSYDTPKIYVDNNNCINFSNPPGDLANLDAIQDLSSSNLVATASGYELKFLVTDYISGALSYYLTGANSVGTVQQHGANVIDRNGEYVIQLNIGDSGPYDVVINNIPQHTTSTFTNNNTIYPSRIEFHDTAGFEGCIDNISLTDITTYFQGGGIEGFVMTGFDSEFNDYISFDSVYEYIVFSSSPILGPTNELIALEQKIEKNFNAGDLCRVNFDFVLTGVAPLGLSYSGAISGYYYNSNGEGFEFGQISGSGNYNALHTIGDSVIGTNTPTIDTVLPQGSVHPLLNTFVVYVLQENTSGTIDNILFRQEFVSINEETISFNENVRGWTSFKSFIPEHSVSLSGDYYTFHNGGMFKHNEEIIVNEKDTNRNMFYGVSQDSTLTLVLNSEPSVIKSFNTLQYEGSQSKIKAFTEYTDPSDGQFYTTKDTYNNLDKKGWSVEFIKTDKQAGTLKEFIEKEGKWFNYITGSPTNPSDTANLNFQGLGIVEGIIIL